MLLLQIFLQDIQFKLKYKWRLSKWWSWAQSRKFDSLNLLRWVCKTSRFHSVFFPPLPPWELLYNQLLYIYLNWFHICTKKVSKWHRFLGIEYGKLVWIVEQRLLYWEENTYKIVTGHLYMRKMINIEWPKKQTNTYMLLTSIPLNVLGCLCLLNHYWETVIGQMFKLKEWSDRWTGHVCFWCVCVFTTL